MRRLHLGAGQSGQGLVEFALVFPVIMLLVFGVFDIGRAVFAYNTITDAARRGARVAVVNQMAPATSVTQCDENMPVESVTSPTWSPRACAAAIAKPLGVQVGDVTVTYSTPAGSSMGCTTPLNVGCIATVTVHYSWAPVTPVIASLVGPITMSSTSQMPVERVFP
jgi:Flp pilus assembly protein TadG